MKSIILASMAALFGTALFTQADAPAIIKGNISALHDAKSFKADLIVRKISGGSPDKETVTYSKDGMFKIDSASTLSVSDGKMVWILDKAANTYTESPASFARTKSPDVWAWASFFSADAFKGMKEYTVKSSKTIMGNSVTEVTMKNSNDKEITLYVDAKTGVNRGMVGTELLVLANQMTVSKDPIDAKEFAFTPPAGAKKSEIKPDSASFADVQKILIANCQGCHNDGNAKSGLSVDSYAGIMKKVVAGDAASSSLYRSVSGGRPKMPAGGAAPLSQKDRDTIAAWINAGAKNE